MKFFTKVKDGGKKSNVDAYFLFEIKGLFSVALLKFNFGTRENYHSHAFHAATWFIGGDLQEHRLDPKDRSVVCTPYKRSLLPKITKRDNLHRVVANKDSWCFTIRGKWSDYWTEYNEEEDKTLVLTHGRNLVRTLNGIKFV